MLNVAMLSKWHVHAEDYARKLQSHGNVKLTAVWDEQPERGREWAPRLGADFETDLDTLLRREDIDGVVVDAPTSMHADVMVAAAEAGKHILPRKRWLLLLKNAIGFLRRYAKQASSSAFLFPPAQGRTNCLRSS